MCTLHYYQIGLTEGRVETQFMYIRIVITRDWYAKKEVLPERSLLLGSNSFHFF